MSTPADIGRLTRIVIGIIIFRDVDGQSFVYITVIFTFEGEWVIFRMTCDIEIASVFSTDNVYACII